MHQVRNVKRRVGDLIYLQAESHDYKWNEDGLMIVIFMQNFKEYIDKHGVKTTRKDVKFYLNTHYAGALMPMRGFGGIGADNDYLLEFKAYTKMMGITQADFLDYLSCKCAPMPIINETNAGALE